MKRDDVDRYLREQSIEHSWLSPEQLEYDSEKYLDPSELSGRYIGIVRDVRFTALGSEDIQILVDFDHDGRVVWMKVFRIGTGL